MRALNVVRPIILAMLVGVAGLAGATAAAAATPDTVYEPVRLESPNPEAQGRFGERSASAGDIDGDGVGDFWMSAFQQSVAGVPLAGRVYLFSGRTRAVIYSVASPEPQRQQRFGFTVDSPGDLNGDGKADLVVSGDAHDDFRGESSPGVANAAPCGAPEPNGCYENTGQVWVYNGATGALLRSLENPQPQSNPELPFSKVFGFGTALSGAGDINGDGRPEVIVGAASNDLPRACGGQAVPVPAAPPAGCRRDQGQAFVFNGATGVLLRTYDIPPADVRPESCNADVNGPGIGTCGLLGQTVQGVGDTDRDGVTDHLVVGGTYGENKAGRMYVFSGRTGARLLTIDNPMPATNPAATDGVRIFGLQTVEEGVPGDVNRDGSADIYGNGFQSPGPTGIPGEGRAWIFSGRDGSILYNLSDPSPEQAGGFAFNVAGTDYDLDGTADELIAGQNGSGTGPNASGGGASVFGVPTAFGPLANAPVLKDFQAPVEDRQPVAPAPANGLRFGRSVTGPGDLNGDCQPDYVIGAPQIDVGGNADQGRVYLELSTGPSGCTTGPPVVPPPVNPPVNPPVTPTTTTTGKFAAKLSLARARLVRSDRVVDVLAPITSLASGRVKVELFAAGQRFRFTSAIDSINGRIRFRQRISKAQADMGTGIITIAYAGDADTRPQTVRLRAAAQKANLNLSRPTIVGGRVKASGTVSDQARGVVRVQVQYDYLGQTRDLSYQARITGGKWAINEKLSPTVLVGIAGRQGTVHSYTLFTGYLPRRMRGEMRSFQVLGER